MTHKICKLDLSRLLGQVYRQRHNDRGCFFTSRGSRTVKHIQACVLEALVGEAYLVRFSHRFSVGRGRGSRTAPDARIVSRHPSIHR